MATVSSEICTHEGAVRGQCFRHIECPFCGQAIRQAAYKGHSAVCEQAHAATADITSGDGDLWTKVAETKVLPQEPEPSGPPPEFDRPLVVVESADEAETLAKELSDLAETFDFMREGSYGTRISVELAEFLADLVGLPPDERLSLMLVLYPSTNENLREQLTALAMVIEKFLPST